MSQSPRSPSVAGANNEVGLNIIVDLHSSANAVLNNNHNENSSGSTSGPYMPVNLQCPATPQLNWKCPELSSTSSSSEDEVTMTTNHNMGEGTEVSARTSSPPPNCAICLGRCRNKCFTDSCMHQFCFKCLCEWSKVKPECPLCKQTFKSIIHNVKSIDQFEEYHVVTPPAFQFRTIDPNMIRNIRLETMNTISNFRRRWLTFEVSLNNGQPIRVGRSTVQQPSVTTAAAAATTTTTAATGHSVSTNNGGGLGVTEVHTLPRIGNGNVNQFVHNSELLNMYRNEYPDGNRNGDMPGTLSQLWRRYIYDRKLYALPLCDVTGRFRDNTARFYRDNPAQVHRLMPWINRDIVCLLRNSELDVTFVLECISEWLIAINILSPHFRRRLQPILGTKTAHFIHELNNFARSPYDMIGYDSAVQYSPQSTEEIVIEFSSSSADDDDTGDALTTDGGAGGGGGDESTRRRVRSHRTTTTTAATIASATAAAATITTSTIATSVTATTAVTTTTTASRVREYRTQSRATNRNNVIPNVPIYRHGDDDDALMDTIAAEINAAQSAAINLTTHNRSSEMIIDLDDMDVDIGGGGGVGGAGANIAGTYADSSEVISATSSSVIITSSTAPDITENIVLSSASSSECEFVLERKPPHLRTPELVSLNSESDSDVVFVGDDSAQRGGGGMERERDRGSEFELEREQEVQTNYSASRRLLEMSLERVPPNVLLTKIENQEAEEEEEQQQHYNVGATTSAGLCSSGRRRRQKSIDMEKNKIHKLRQRNRRRAMRNNNNTRYTLYESTSTTTSTTTTNTSDESDNCTETETKRKRKRRICVRKRRESAKSAAASRGKMLKDRNRGKIIKTETKKRKRNSEEEEEEMEHEEQCGEMHKYRFGLDRNATTTTTAYGQGRYSESAAPNLRHNNTTRTSNYLYKIVSLPQDMDDVHEELRPTITDIGRNIQRSEERIQESTTIMNNDNNNVEADIADVNDVDDDKDRDDDDDNVDDDDDDAGSNATSINNEVMMTNNGSMITAEIATMSVDNSSERSNEESRQFRAHSSVGCATRATITAATTTTATTTSASDISTTTTSSSSSDESEVEHGRGGGMALTQAPSRQEQREDPHSSNNFVMSAVAAAAETNYDDADITRLTALRNGCHGLRHTFLDPETVSRSMSTTYSDNADYTDQNFDDKYDDDDDDNDI